MDTISDSANKINKMYKKLTYLDQYGGSVFLFFILLILLFVIHSYFVVMKNIEPIKQNWTAERCKPQNIPFAGFINKPADMSYTEFTSQNFNYCLNGIQTSITGYLLEPITYLTHTLTLAFAQIVVAMQFLRTIFDRIRNSISDIAGNIMGRMANIIIPLQQIIIGIRDTMEKIKGILAAGVYTSLGTYYVLQSLMGAIAEITIIILIALAAVIVTTWIISIFFPPFISAAITMTMLFICVSIPLAIILVFMSDVLHVNINDSIPQVPSRPAPSCFDKDTRLRMNDGSYKTISKIRVGDKLQDNNVVTATLKLAASRETMYCLYGIIVSGTHRVFYKDQWLLVQDHPDSMKISTYVEPFIYCLNTKTKRILTDTALFMDWDELIDEHVNRLSSHKQMNVGFHRETRIDMKYGNSKKIEDVQVGDILVDGSTVYGLVEIDGSYKVHLGQHDIIMNSSNADDKTICNITEPVLYHLLTTTQIFMIGAIQVNDYNSAIELFLEGCL